ncbi:cAMP-specific 3',5'-cyclic phosphodiesterase 4D [Chytridiales sp. JEL 0842]|nr:cAMP-specific 3',5'-cyclic phosphodiesterase 4D [Chytridiales sp. JEL 0842]
MQPLQPIQHDPKNDSCFPLHQAFARLLQSLHKIGDDLYIEARENKLVLSTVNASRSAFAIFTVWPTFFDSYKLTSNQTVSCKVLLKTITNIFKQKTNIDSIERCKIFFQDGPNGDRLVIQLYCKFGVKKTHKLHFESCEAIHAVYSKQNSDHKLIVSPKVIHEWLGYFSQKLEEVTIRCGKDWVRVKSFSEPANESDILKLGLQTEITIDPEDFDVFDVQYESDVTFSLKDFKAVTQPVAAYFNKAGQPVILCVAQQDVFMADFVLATLSESAMTQYSTTTARSAAPRGTNSQSGSYTRGASSTPGDYPASGGQEVPIHPPYTNSEVSSSPLDPDIDIRLQPSDRTMPVVGAFRGSSFNNRNESRSSFNNKPNGRGRYQEHEQDKDGKEDSDDESEIIPPSPKRTSLPSVIIRRYATLEDERETSPPPKKLNIPMHDRSGNVIGKIVVSPSGVGSLIVDDTKAPQIPAAPVITSRQPSNLTTVLEDVPIEPEVLKSTPKIQPTTATTSTKPSSETQLQHQKFELAAVSTELVITDTALQDAPQLKHITVDIPIALEKFAGDGAIKVHVSESLGEEDVQKPLEKVASGFQSALSGQDISSQASTQESNNTKPAEPLKGEQPKEIARLSLTITNTNRNSLDFAKPEKPPQQPRPAMRDRGMSNREPRDRLPSTKETAMRDRVASNSKDSPMRDRTISNSTNKEKRRTPTEEAKRLVNLDTINHTITIDTAIRGAEVPDPKHISSERQAALHAADDNNLRAAGSTALKAYNNNEKQAQALLNNKDPSKQAKRQTVSLNASLKNYSNTNSMDKSSTKNAGDTLHGITDPWFLKFDDEKLEQAYQKYFASAHKPSWRLGTLIHIILLVLIMAYQMLVYPIDAKDFLSLQLTRDTVASTNISITLPALPSGCIPGYICAPCENGRLCNAYNFLHEALFFGVGALLPICTLYILSYTGYFKFCKKDTSTEAAIYTLLMLAIPISARHAVVEPTVSPYKTAMLYVFSFFTSMGVLRPRLFHVLAISPVAFAIFVAEASATSVLYRMEKTSVVISALTVTAALVINCITTYEYERKARLQFLKSQSSMNINEKLFNQLKDMHKNYSDRIVDFDSPLEKAIGMISLIRMDPMLNKEHFESMGVVLALLTSKDLMTPDIERQVTVGRVALDEEGEAWLFSNLYRGRARGNSKANTAQRQSMVVSASMVPSALNDHQPAPAKPRGMSISSTGVESQAGSRISYTSMFPNERKKSFMPDDDGFKNRSVKDESSPRLSLNAAQTAHKIRHEIHKQSLAPASTFGRPLSSIEASPVSLNTPESVADSTNSVYKRHGTILGSSVEVESPSETSSRYDNDPTPGSASLNSDDSLDNLNSQLQMIALLEKADHWNWDIFELDNLSKRRPLFTLAHYLFLKSNLYSKFQIPMDVFLHFMTIIESGYRADVPYHNSVHATDVLHGVNFLTNTCRIMNIQPTDLELLSLYVAAVVHDYDHVINTSDQKALLYNDRSVLENHHLASAFSVLARPECNFIAHLPRDDYRQMREMVIELVLATDLQTQHFAILSMFKNKVSLTKTFDPAGVEEDRTLLWKMIIKCADVSNPTKAWPIYEKWTDRVLQEFFMQGDSEKMMGLPVSPYYDRDTIFVPGSQLGFIDFICVPLYEAFDLFTAVPIILEGLYHFF